MAWQARAVARRGSIARVRPRVGGWLGLAAGLLVLGVSSAGAEVSLRAAVTPPRVTVGATAELSVEVDGVQDAPAPAIPVPEGVRIDYVGPSTRIALVNGRMSASITHRYSVLALKVGTFSIGPIRLDYRGETYDAGSVTLTVVAAARQAPGESAPAAGDQPLWLVLTPAKTEVFLHERVPVRVKLHVGNIRVSDVQYPTVAGDGFALEKFPEPRQYTEPTAGGGTVEVLEFRTALVPLRAGALGVGPARIELSVVTRRGGVDPFFERFFGGDPFGTARRPLALESEPLVLNVLPLPEEGKPSDFSGAVGRFAFEVTAAPLDLGVGDPVTITMTVHGTGNLENAIPPAVAASDALRVYPTQQNPQPAPGTVPAGTEAKVYEQVVIPQREGTLALPEIRFSYFDPQARRYHTIGRSPATLSVHASAEPAAPPRVVGAAPVAPDAETLGRDIVFIKESPGDLQPRGVRWYRAPLFWAYQALPLVAWLAAVFYDRRRRLLRGDARYARYARAGREARRALAAARAALQAGDPARFYDTLTCAVRDYLAAKLDLPPGAVTAEAVTVRLRATGVAPPVADEVHTFFAACEQVRFASAAAGDGDMQQALGRATAIVRRIERERRLAPPWALALALVGLAAAAWAATAAGGAAFFFRGNELYGAERYAEAAAEYERVLEGGAESANLHFNLGNAYFKAGDLGRAILNYERAARLAPRDPDLAANLGYARTRAGDAPAVPLYARLLFPLASRMTADELVTTASAAYTALMLLLVVARLVPTLRRAARGGAVASAVALAVLAASAGYRLATVDLPSHAVVIAGEEAAVRFEPSATGTVHFAARTGSVLRVLAERELWAQVTRRDGRRGWIERAALARI